MSVIDTELWSAAGKCSFHRGAVLCLYLAFHRLLRVVRLHHVPSEGRPTSYK